MIKSIYWASYMSVHSYKIDNPSALQCLFWISCFVLSFFSSIFIWISHNCASQNLLCELNFITEAWYGFQNLMWNLCGEHLMISLNETYLEWHYRFNMWKFWPISQCILFDRKNLPVDGIHSWNFHQRIKFYQKNDTPRNGRSMWCWFLLVSMLWIFGQQFFYKCLCLWTNSVHVIRQWDLHRV